MYPQLTEWDFTQVFNRASKGWNEKMVAHDLNFTLDHWRDLKRKFPRLQQEFDRGYAAYCAMICDGLLVLIQRNDTSTLQFLARHHLQINSDIKTVVQSCQQGPYDNCSDEAKQRLLRLREHIYGDAEVQTEVLVSDATEPVGESQPSNVIDLPPAGRNGSEPH